MRILISLALLLMVNPVFSYDVVIVLGHLPVNNFTDISGEWVGRINHGLKFAYNSTPLILSGEYSELAVNYVGFPVIVENESLDTVGNAVFTKRIILENNWTDLLVVTSNYHVQRAYKDFRNVYGDNFEISFSGIDAGLSELELFTVSIMEFFKAVFKKVILFGVPAGEHELMLERLRVFHPWYILSQNP